MNTKRNIRCGNCQFFTNPNPVFFRGTVSKPSFNIVLATVRDHRTPILDTPVVYVGDNIVALVGLCRFKGTEVPSCGYCTEHKMWELRE